MPFISSHRQRFQNIHDLLAEDVKWCHVMRHVADGGVVDYHPSPTLVNNAACCSVWIVSGIGFAVVPAGLIDILVGTFYQHSVQAMNHDHFWPVQRPRMRSIHWQYWRPTRTISESIVSIRVALPSTKSESDNCCVNNENVLDFHEKWHTKTAPISSIHSKDTRYSKLLHWATIVENLPRNSTKA